MSVCENPNLFTQSHLWYVVIVKVRIVFRNLNVTLLYVTAMPFIVNNMQPLVFHFIPGLRAQS